MVCVDDYDAISSRRVREGEVIEHGLDPETWRRQLGVGEMRHTVVIGREKFPWEKICFFPGFMMVCYDAISSRRAREGEVIEYGLDPATWRRQLAVGEMWHTVVTGREIFSWDKICFSPGFIMVAGYDAISSRRAREGEVIERGLDPEIWRRQLAVGEMWHTVVIGREIFSWEEFCFFPGFLVVVGYDAISSRRIREGEVIERGLDPEIWWRQLGVGEMWTIMRRAGS